MAPEYREAFRSSKQFTVDLYSPLDYKHVLATDRSHGEGWMAPTWTGWHRRRLQAYTVLQSYPSNVARMLQRVFNPKQLSAREEWREYGDPAVLLEEILSSTIGDQQSIAVVGADEYDKDKQNPEAKAAFELQQELMQWAEDEQLVIKMIQAEGDASKFGDGVYGLGFDPVKKRVRLQVWDPGSYFPVIDEYNGLDFPTRVHIAYEIVDDDDNADLKVRRITYDLRPVDEYDVPWSDEKVSVACFLSDGIFTIKQENRDPDDLTIETAEWKQDSEGEIRDRNLRIDFIPIIHMPNTVAGPEHFGKSDLLNIVQLIDDIQSTDTDTAAAVGLTGGPMLALSGRNVGGTKLELGPRQVLKLGENGRADMLSGAEGIAALDTHQDKQLERLSVNARIPAAKLGRIDPTKLDAGIIMTLSFGPLGSLVERKRLVRKPKYRLLFKFKQRFDAIEARARRETPRPILEADMVFGSYLPSDLGGMATIILQLVNAKLISVKTGQKMLQELGVPIEDLSEEQRDIERTDYEAANLLADLGAEDEAAKRLGVKLDRPAQQDVAPTSAPPVPPGEQPPADENAEDEEGQ